ncbi:MAG: TolC family protein [Butyrivibrio sp.]|nr:TolC family protein [Butyrivibrio sp.]
MRAKRVFNCIIAAVTAIACFTTGGIQASAASMAEQQRRAMRGRTLTLSAARALALEESSAYYGVEQQIASKKAKLKSAKKSIRLKEKNMATFRWSPLISFKLPTKPDEETAFEFTFKPVEIQSEIDIATHKLTDTKLAVYEKVNILYVQIVVLQRTIAFSKQRLEALNDGIARNEARVVSGEGTQADVDSLKKKKASTENKIAADERNLAASLRRLSTMVGTDISTAYRFEMPFVEAQIKRDQLPALIEYTLDNDQGYYEACMSETTAKTALSTNYNLMKKHYGNDINIISSYITQSLNGEKVNARAFYADYKTFLTKIDSYWEGFIWIPLSWFLWLPFPKLWFKGSLDGSRYIEQDPNVAYQAALDYSSALNDKIDSGNAVREEVTGTFETYVSVRNAYLKAIADLDQAEKDLQADTLRNRIGELSFEELSSEQDDYEELQNSLFEAMQTYTDTLYEFDRLTCGGVSILLEGTDQSLQTAAAGVSYVEDEYADGASYFIRQIIQSQEFVLSINIPEDFEVEVTDYELWCDNTQIGARTKITDSIRHLALVKDDLKETKLRFYNGTTFVDDVIIDPSADTGPLPIISDMRIVKKESNELGRYEVTRGEVTGLITVKLTVTEDPKIAYYQVQTEDGAFLTGEEPLKLDKSFTHLGLVENGLSEVKIIFMDEGKSPLYEGRFDTVNHKLLKKEEGADEQQQEAAE